jgi:hypothetical protein
MEEKRQQITNKAVQPRPDCPPSPDDETFVRQQEEAMRANSYSSVNSNSEVSQTTSPSNITSPISSNLGSSSDQIFPSVPSLPALISCASSVSADTEGDMLQRPGVPSQSWTADSTPETLTPPALSKEVSQDAEIPLAATDDTILLSPDADEEGYNGDGDAYTVDGDDDSDSDEGLTMTRRRPKSKSVSGPIEPRASVRRLERRDTNNSVGSAETAKKMVLEG